jgi:hypothetical protein
VGLPRETLTIDHDQVMIDGRIPDGEVFVMGDLDAR